MNQFGIKRLIATFGHGEVVVNDGHYHENMIKGSNVPVPFLKPMLDHLCQLAARPDEGKMTFLFEDEYGDLNLINFSDHIARHVGWNAKAGAAWSGWRVWVPTNVVEGREIILDALRHDNATHCDCDKSTGVVCMTCI